MPTGRTPSVINVSAGTGATTNATNTTDTTPEILFNLTDNAETDQINVSVYVGFTGGTLSYDGSKLITNNTIGRFNLSARANGTFLVRFEANDSARNLANASLLTITVDDTAPVFQAFTGSGGTGATLNATNTTDTTPEVLFNLTDNAETDQINVSVYIGGTYDNSFLFTNNTIGRYNLSARANGTFSVRFEANDSAGNLANASLFTIYVDDTKPSFQSFNSTTGTTNNATNFTDTTPEIIVNFTDAGGSFTLINVSLYIGSTFDHTELLANNTLARINVTSARANGTFILRLESNDSAGNLANASLLTITVDDTKPVFQPFNPGNSTSTNATNTTDTTPEIAVNLTDNGFTTINVSVYIDSTFMQTFLFTNNTINRVNLTARANGTFWIRFEANDSSANLANASLLTITVDDTKPAFNTFDASNGATDNATNTTDTTPEILVNLTDNGFTSINISAYIDGTFTQTYLITNNTITRINLSMAGNNTPANGTHIVRFEANDSSGNLANASLFTITTDAEAPYITISSPVNNTNTTDLTPAFQFTLIDNSSAFLNVLNWTIWVDGAVNGQTGLAANNTLVNVSLNVLSNVTHNITIQVGDFLNNTRNLTRWHVSTDAVAPVLTISHSPTTIYQGNVVTVSCTIAENLLTVASKLTVTKPNSQVTTLSGCGAEFGDTTAVGTYTITLTANDTAGNGATSTKTFAVSDSGGSSSSSSGGGGSSSAAASTPSTTASKTLIVDSFVPDKPNVVKLTSENIGFKEISVDITNKVNAVEIKVVKTDSAPAEVTKAVEGKVYQYIEIKHDKLKDDNIKSAKVKFTVTNKWATDNGVAKENVVLKRFKEGSWTDMKTTLSSESSTETTYEAELPGLSVFAIGEAVPTAAAQQPAEQPSQQTGQQPAQQPATPSAPEQPSAQQPTAAYSNETMYYVAGGVILVLIIAYFWVKARKIGKTKKK
ncbi:MAG: PGF-pre-PGF domain-containing protein [Candidatus Aenigmarchaeota archaeon]|nr:PGF-pre-PGF domain-containing protein [Candidatus Aenigmarchaeota archaeon]